MLDIPPLTHTQFLQQLENNSLDPCHFNHLGHIRLAWIYLTNHQYPVAVSNICRAIQAYAESLGARDKFNMTITVAIMQIMSKRLNDVSDKSWQDFCAKNPDIMEDALSLLLSHYSREKLFSNTAKLVILRPDIKPI